MAKDYYNTPFGTVLGPRPWVSEFDTKFNEDGLFHFELVLERGKETDAFVEKVKAEAEASRERQLEALALSPAERKRWALYSMRSPSAFRCFHS